MKKKNKLLQNNRGTGEQYIQFAVVSLIVAFLIYGIAQSAPLFTSVVKMNNVAELVSKKIQLSGVVNNDTQILLNEALKNSRIKNYEAIVTVKKESGDETVTITATSTTIKKIQLNDTYTVIIKGHTKFFMDNKTVGGKAVGISEVYAK